MQCRMFSPLASSCFQTGLTVYWGAGLCIRSALHKMCNKSLFTLLNRLSCLKNRHRVLFSFVLGLWKRWISSWELDDRTIIVWEATVIYLQFRFSAWQPVPDPVPVCGGTLHTRPSSRSSIPWLFGLILPGRLFHATMACNTSSRSYHIDSLIITDCFHFWLFGHYSGMATSMYMRAKERQILKQGEAAPLDAPLFSLFLHWCLNDWSMASDIWEWKILR